MSLAIQGAASPTQQALPAHRQTARPPQASKVVVVHSGARDRYQIALGLSQAGLLQCLVTDFFWSEETPFRHWLAQRLPARLLSMLRQRSVPGLPPSQVKTCLSAAFAGFLLDKAQIIPYGVRRWFTRQADATLGRVAGRTARRTGAELLSYSYYAYDAFRAAGKPGMLFQMHPHPETMRDLLLAEIAAHPDCAASLQQEWELNLPPADFQRLVDETTMPARSLTASSFTRRSLLDHGSAPESVGVAPYGIDLEKFRPDTARSRSTQGALKLLFVGRINQRKGIKYLLQAIAALPDAELELTVCGRVLDGLDLFEQAGARVRIRPSVSAEDLVKAYQEADLFVLPSIAEGFGQVLLEALACGLPILATTHTAAPDLIHEGREGFIVEPRRPDLLADRIRWALEHRAELLAMRSAARTCAEQFPWSRFHDEVTHAVHQHLIAASAAAQEPA
ncbi:MAG: glycosyltransferase family 4 protein [Janthinobacterium lividum]